MLITPNFSTSYRMWAYCNVKIRELSKQFELYKANRVTHIGEFYRLKGSGRRAYNNYCSAKCAKLAHRIECYTRFRDKLALELDSPENSLLTVADMLDMSGHVIDITPRHGRKKIYKVLTACSPDGTRMGGLDAMELLSFGYGR